MIGYTAGIGMIAIPLMYLVFKLMEAMANAAAIESTLLTLPVG